MKYIISVWTWILAVLMFAMFLIWFLVVANIWSHKTYIKWVRTFLKAFFKILFIRIEVLGEENIDPSKNYLFMSNHVSMFDIPLLITFIPVPFWGIQASSHFKVPVFGWVLKKYGNLPIDRSSPRASLKTMMDAVEKIKSGKNIMILPEGTRSMHKEMGEFKKLPFVMAKRANVGIIPIAFVGLWEINNKTSLMIHPRKMKMVFGKPIDSSLVESMSEVELRAHTRERIQEMLDAHEN